MLMMILTSAATERPRYGLDRHRVLHAGSHAPLKQAVLREILRIYTVDRKERLEQLRLQKSS